MLLVHFRLKVSENWRPKKKNPTNAFFFDTFLFRWCIIHIVSRHRHFTAIHVKWDWSLCACDAWRNYYVCLFVCISEICERDDVIFVYSQLSRAAKITQISLQLHESPEECAWTICLFPSFFCFCFRKCGRSRRPNAGTYFRILILLLWVCFFLAQLC